MISLLSFIFAGTSFLNEMNLAQALSASLGGTAIRYQTTFGLFTFFLGLGALIFDYLKQKLEIKNILIYSQIGMIFIGAFGPLWIKILDPISNFEYITILTILSYLPICFCGLISGLELPALVSIENNLQIKKFQALAWDYIGMFAASVSFSLWLLYFVGVYFIGLISSILSLIGLLLFLFLTNKQKLETNLDSTLQKPSSKYSKNTLFLFFTLSFCSFAYELLLAKVLSDIFNDETLAYSLGIGFLLLGLGFGSFYAEKIKKPLASLITTEVLIIAICSIQFSLIHFLATVLLANPNLQFLANHKYLSFIIFSPFPFIIGLLTGLELPLLLKLFPNVKNIGLPISLNYTGALFAGFTIPFFLLPNFGAANSFQIICCLNIIATFILIFMQKNILNFRTLLLPLIILLFFLPIRKYNHTSEQFFLKTYYYQLNLTNYNLMSLINFKNIIKNIPEVNRTTSVYQNIDIILKNNHPFFGNEGNSLYLNKQPQFNSSSWKTYHQSMAWAGFNLNKNIPKRVLVCGGGDGILARILAEERHVEKIDLVELDSKMIELAKNIPFIKEINNNSLENPKINIVIDDAYRFLKKSKIKYDAIYLDFPYPDNFDLSRLYSLEFYQAVIQKLDTNGYLIIDAPIRNYIVKKPKYISDQRIIEETLKASGFGSVIAFGSIEPFIFATPLEKKISFDYERFPQDIPNRTFVNLVILENLNEDVNKNIPINSMFFPVRFFRNE